MKAKYFNKSKEEQLFFFTLKNRVYDKLSDKSISYGDTRFWVKGFFWTFICYLSYSILFVDSLGKMNFWLAYVVFQLSGLLIGFSFGHDASHNTAFKNKKANSILHFFSFLVSLYKIKGFLVVL